MAEVLETLVYFYEERVRIMYKRRKSYDVLFPHNNNATALQNLVICVTSQLRALLLMEILLIVRILWIERQTYTIYDPM